MLKGAWHSGRLEQHVGCLESLDIFRIKFEWSHSTISLQRRLHADLKVSLSKQLDMNNQDLKSVCCVHCKGVFDLEKGPLAIFRVLFLYGSD